MKRYCTIPALLLFSIFLCIHTLHAQEWDPIVVLVDNDGDLFEPQIVTNGDIVHVVWTDSRDTYLEVYYKRSMDGGLNWEPGKRISKTEDAASYYPAIACWEDHIYVAWIEATGIDLNDIFFCYSDDGGQTFSDPVYTTIDLTWYYNPRLAVFENNVHLMWNQYGAFPDVMVFHTMTQDNGISWTTPVKLSPFDKEAYGFDVMADGQNVYVMWAIKDAVSSQIYFTRSADNGMTWTPPVSIKPTNAPSTDVTFNVGADNKIHLVWTDGRFNPHVVLYYMNSSDGGATWGMESQLTEEFFDSFGPNMAISGETIHLCWSDSRESHIQVFYMFSENNGMDWSEQVRISESDVNSWYAKCAGEAKNAYIVWEEDNYYSDVLFRRKIDHFSVDEWSIAGNKEAVLFQNNPNPFTDHTCFRFYLPHHTEAGISIYNLSGKLITTVGHSSYNKGEHRIKWNAAEVEAGMYYYVLKTGEMDTGSAILKKMIIQ